MKKGFKDDNPAMAFISQRDAEPGNFANPSGDLKLGLKSEETSPTGGEKRVGTAVPPAGDSSGKIEQGSKSERTGSRSDTFAPSLRLAGTDVSPGGEKNKYRMDPRYIETKSRRFGILLQPSVLESLKVLAGEKGISVNEAVNEAIKQYIQREEGEISFKGDQW